MVPDRRLDRSPEVCDCPYEFRTPYRVALHQHSLLWRKPTCLPQERGELLVDLPDIVKKGRRSDLINLLGRQPHLPGHRFCILCYPDRVAGRIRVTSLDCLDHQIEKLSVCAFQLEIHLTGMSNEEHRHYQQDQARKLQLEIKECE